MRHFVVPGATALAMFMLVLVLRQEYKWWAPRLAEFILRLASSIVPSTERARCLREWNADLESPDQKEGPILFALTVLFRAPFQIRRELRLEREVGDRASEQGTPRAESSLARQNSDLRDRAKGMRRWLRPPEIEVTLYFKYPPHVNGHAVPVDYNTPPDEDTESDKPKRDDQQ